MTSSLTCNSLEIKNDWFLIHGFKSNLRQYKNIDPIGPGLPYVIQDLKSKLSIILFFPRTWGLMQLSLLFLKAGIYFSDWDILRNKQSFI